MGKTRHIQERMSQRGIRQDIVDLVLRYGEYKQDKVILGRKGLEILLKELREIERVTLRALDKGGVVVVVSGDPLITTYNLNSFNRRKAYSA